MATGERVPFPWQDVESLPDLERLRLVLDVLPDEEILASLEAGRGRGRNDYPVRAMWRALIAGIVFQHASIQSLLRELGRNAALLDLCGFYPLPFQGAPVTELCERTEGRRCAVTHPAPVRDTVPSHWNFSRFLGCLIRLEDERGLVSGMIGSLRASLFEELPDFGRHLGYDGKGIESHSTGRIGEGEEHASDPDADWGKHETTGVNGKTGAIWKKVKSWFGFLNRASTASRAAGPIREDLDRAMSGLRTGAMVSTRRFQPGASAAERSRLPGRTWLAHCAGHRDKVRNGSAKPVMFHVSVLAGMWGSLDSGEKTCVNTTSCRRDRIPLP